MMSTLRRRIEPSSTAVLVIDVQNDFCSPDGAVEQAGRPLRGRAEMVEKLGRLVAGARTAGANVIFVQTIARSWTDSDPWLYRASDTPRTDTCREGTWGAEFFEVAPIAGEPVIVKHRNSAFFNTELDSVLRTLKVQSLILSGTSTNVSVESTARDGIMRDYHIVLAEDCSAARSLAAHESTLMNIRNHFGIVTSCDEVLGIWNDQLVGVGAPVNGEKGRTG
jgi:ureidoacrylate peracid hydrolase